MSNQNMPECIYTGTNNILDWPILFVLGGMELDLKTMLKKKLKVYLLFVEH